jgi:hypothetical protein
MKQGREQNNPVATGRTPEIFMSPATNCRFLNEHHVPFLSQLRELTNVASPQTHMQNSMFIVLCYQGFVIFIIQYYYGKQ